jgi:hypothetical protein
VSAVLHGGRQYRLGIPLSALPPAGERQEGGRSHANAAGCIAGAGGPASSFLVRRYTVTSVRLQDQYTVAPGEEI